MIEILLSAIETIFSTYLNIMLTYFDISFTNLSNTAFNMEDYLTSNIGLDFNAFYVAVRAFGVYLIVLKLLMKGFNVYILWNEGDSDMDPFILLTGFFKALIIALCFDTIYGFAIDIPEALMSDVLRSVNTIDLESTSLADIFVQITAGLYGVNILIVVYFVLYILLWIQFAKRGFEIFALKVGVPLACCGLMDSDGGIFSSYTKKFLQEIFTVLVQVFFLKFSLVLMLNMNFLFGFAAISAALKAPQFLQDFIMTYGGGQGVASRTTQGMYMASMARSLIKAR